MNEKDRESEREKKKPISHQNDQHEKATEILMFFFFVCRRMLIQKIKYILDINEKGKVTKKETQNSKME